MYSRFFVLGTWFALVAVGLAGCQGSPVALARGKVMVDGTPAEKGMIAFYPKDGKGKTAGGEIKDGVYSVEVPVGLMEVKINVPKLLKKVKLYDTPDSPEKPIYGEALPARYNLKTELTLDVPAAGIEKDWALTAK